MFKYIATWVSSSALIFCVSTGGFAVIGYAATNTHSLTAEQWNVPRQAVTIIDIPPIRATIEEFQAAKNSQILIKYPDGDVGTLWANELRSGLILLGISAKFIELVPGSTNPEHIEFLVSKSRH